MRLRIRSLASSVVALVLTACAVADRPPPVPKYATEFVAVDVEPSAPAPLKLAVQACAGLKNRKLGGSVYVRTTAHDQKWLTEFQLKPKASQTATEFVTACAKEFPACVRYAYKDQQPILPAILTAAAALGAVPLDTAAFGPGGAVTCAAPAFDAVAALQDHATPLLATTYVFKHFVDQTTGLAMLNPGYDLNAKDLANPPIVHDMGPELVDFVFAQKLFVLFLVNGCREPDPENTLLSTIVNSGHWLTPLGVYGYNNSWNVGGFLYEAQTRCLKTRNMGAIPSETNNLAFFSSRRAALTETSRPSANPPEKVAYDPSKTYVAFVVGDGDNVAYLLTTRREWFAQRQADCMAPATACPTLTWSLSPHIARLAPDVMQWYYQASRATGKDFFILPPSGHFYAYPSSMGAQDQEKFAAATDADARLLGVHGTVHWEWFDSWHAAEDAFVPKYARANSAIRGVFPVNVPYMLPMFPWWPAEKFFRVVAGADGGKAVLFKPREWRGVDGSDDEFYPKPQTMAAQLGAYPKGTVTWVYMTSDGGLNLHNSVGELSAQLPPHVQLVSADAAIALALAAGGP
ncbi:MAG: hypothetical protein EXR77_19510 [Myxococcales bacterium]|nr:hypothetical protein [Myxococcales bacterium]